MTSVNPSPHGNWSLGFQLAQIENEMCAATAAGVPLHRAGPFELVAMTGWGSDRTVRAEVLRYLLVEEDWQVHAKGVQLKGLLISGKLDLESATIRCPLHLQNCYFDHDGPVVLDYATASVLSLRSCCMAGLRGDALVVTGELDLTGTTFTGPLRLSVANINAQLGLRGAQLESANQEGYALTAYGIKVGGHAVLDSTVDQGTFTAAGAVNLVGAEIGGNLYMRGAHLDREDKDGFVLTAYSIKVGGHMILASGLGQGTFTAAGAIDLVGAQIGGNLNMRGSQLTRADKDGIVLKADQISVRNVHLGADSDQQAFTAVRTVSLADARLGGSLDLAGADLILDPEDLNVEAQKIALNAEGTQITRKLIWRPVRAVRARVHLEGAAAAELDDYWGDNRNNGFWPSDLRLDGFTYTTISADDGASPDQRLEWIRGALGSGHGNRVSGQPYQQLADVYRREGNDTAARKVAIAARRDQRRGSLSVYRRGINWLLDVTIGYGYRTVKALIYLVILYGIVLLITFIALGKGAIVPVPQSAVGVQPPPVALHGCAANYPCFNSFGYAFDTVVPIINLHQADYWRPDSHVAVGEVLLWVSWAGTVLGWLLVTLAVAGYTGLARRVDAP